MTDRPIIFSAPMAKALLDGRKSQTRRILNPQPQPTVKVTKFVRVATETKTGRAAWESHDDAGPVYAFRQGKNFVSPYAHTPSAGDRLWVREAFCGPIYELDNNDNPIGEEEEYFYRVDGYPYGSYLDPETGKRRDRPPWRPSIFMPKGLSRLTLIVTDVRIQRLQDISEEDARAEGCVGTRGPNPDFPDEWDPSPQEEFRDLWNSIHGKDAWSANPWVMAVSFKVRKANIDALEKESA